MKHCATCRFWEPPSDDEMMLSLINPEDPVSYEQAETERAIEEKWGHKVRYCMNPRLRFWERPARDEASVVDGSEYMGQLITGPDFGCSLHEDGPPPEKKTTVRRF